MKTNLFTKNRKKNVCNYLQYAFVIFSHDTKKNNINININNKKGPKGKQ